MSLFAAVKRANRPGPPEHSITLRVACAGAVVTGIVVVPGRGRAVVGRRRRLGHARRGRHDPGVPDPPTTAALDQAHPRHQRGGSLRVVLPPADGPDHLRRQHRGEPPRRPVRMGTGSARLRRPGPARPRLLAGRVGQPHGGGRRPGHRPRLRRLRPGVVRLRSDGARGDVELGQRGRATAPGRRGRHVGVRRREWHRGARPPPRAACGGAHRLPLRHRTRLHPARAGRAGRGHQGGPARQTGDDGRSDPRRRVPGLLQPSRHSPAGRPRQHGGDAGPRRSTVVLDR